MKEEAKETKKKRKAVVKQPTKITAHILTGKRARTEERATRKVARKNKQTSKARSERRVA